MSVPDLIWHYTKHDVLEKILINHELWASEIAGLNDATELRLGNKRVRQAFRTMKENWDDHDPGALSVDFKELKESLKSASVDLYHGSAFVTCFSSAFDDTEQWQKYALADGFAVGIPRNVYLPVVGEHYDEPTFSAYIEEFPFRWLDLIYDKKTQLELATQAIWEIRDGDDEGAFVDARHDEDDNFGSIFRDQGTSGYVYAVAAIKNKAFAREREVRYVVARPNNEAAIRSNPGGRYKHVCVTGSRADPFSTSWDQHDPDYYQEIPSNLPIVTIVVGPGNDFGTQKDRIRSILDANGYGSVDIVKSKSPLK